MRGGGRERREERGRREGRGGDSARKGGYHLKQISGLTR